MGGVSPLRIAALLPHVDVFGGVRRYLELGNALTARGHRFVLYHPAGDKPAWLDFKAETRPFSALGEESFDVALCGEFSILGELGRIPARLRYFYFVLEGHKLERTTTRRSDLLFLGNSEGICRRLERRYGIMVRRAPGGVNPVIFHPLEAAKPAHGGEFRILCYGRITRRRKGVVQVIRAAEGLLRRGRRVKLIFFDTQVGQDRGRLSGPGCPSISSSTCPRAAWPGCMPRPTSSSAPSAGPGGRTLAPKPWPAGYPSSAPPAEPGISPRTA
jgi:glycosyltransferase involved in cell wall biosynthesis